MNNRLAIVLNPNQCNQKLALCSVHRFFSLEDFFSTNTRKKERISKHRPSPDTENRDIILSLLLLSSTVHDNQNPKIIMSLTNCYVPLVIPGSGDAITTAVTTPTTKSREEQQAFLLANRSSGDELSKNTRSHHALRQLRMETGILANAAGSSLVELGHTKIVCSMEGPYTSDLMGASPGISLDEGVLQCTVSYAPHMGMKMSTSVSTSVTTLDGHNQTNNSSKTLQRTNMSLEVEMASALQDALASAIPLQQYPKCLYHIHVTVLQDDGSALSAAIVAASLAVCDAGMEMVDLVCASTVACMNTGSSSSSENTTTMTMIADPTEDELLVADATLTIAVMPNWKEVTLWEHQQTAGRQPLSSEESSRALELCRDGCRTMHKFMKQSLIANHESGQP